MRSVKYILPLIICLLGFQAGGVAKGKIKQLWDRFIGPNPKLDSTYIFQPQQGWMAGVTYKAQWTGVKLTLPVEFIEQGEVVDRGLAESNIIDRMSHQVGVTGGFGPLNLSYSFELVKKDSRNRNINFDWLSSNFGIKFHYGRIFENASSTVTREDEVILKYNGYPASANLLDLEGYYVFNSKRFGFPAAYKGKIIQRKSAGSVLVGAKFHHARVWMENSAMTFFLYGNNGFVSDQLSLGVGYSYNIVAYHKDAVSSNDLRGLRNLTFNLTAIPLLTFLDELTLTGHEPMEAHGRVTPNFIARAAIGFTIWHFYLNALADFQFNQFHSTPFQLGTERLTYQFSAEGRIPNWSASIQLKYRF